MLDVVVDAAAFHWLEIVEFVQLLLPHLVVAAAVVVVVAAAAVVGGG